MQAAMKSSQIPTDFWISRIGCEIVQAGPYAVTMAFYLQTNQKANAIGLYALPFSIIPEQVNMAQTLIDKALDALEKIGFCVYDRENEIVYVKNMIHQQVAPFLKNISDNRVKWINNMYNELPESPLLFEFYKDHGKQFHVKQCRGEQQVQTAPIENDVIEVETTAPTEPIADVVDIGQLFNQFWDTACSIYSKVGSKPGREDEAEQAFIKAEPVQIDVDMWLGQMALQMQSRLDTKESDGWCEDFKHISRWIKFQSWKDFVDSE